MANPNPSNQWKKGQSGNPKGRTAKYSITAMFREMFTNSPERKKELGEAIYKKAVAGDPTALKLVWHYMDGKPINNLDVKSGGEKLEFVWKTEK